MYSRIFFCSFVSFFLSSTRSFASLKPAAFVGTYELEIYNSEYFSTNAVCDIGIHECAKHLIITQSPKTPKKISLEHQFESREGRLGSRIFTETFTEGHDEGWRVFYAVEKGVIKKDTFTIKTYQKRRFKPNRLTKTTVLSRDPSSQSLVYERIQANEGCVHVCRYQHQF